MNKSRKTSIASAATSQKQFKIPTKFTGKSAKSNVLQRRMMAEMEDRAHKRLQNLNSNSPEIDHRANLSVVSHQAKSLLNSPRGQASLRNNAGRENRSQERI